MLKTGSSPNRAWLGSALSSVRKNFGKADSASILEKQNCNGRISNLCPHPIRLHSCKRRLPPTLIQSSPRATITLLSMFQAMTKSPFLPSWLSLTMIFAGSCNGAITFYDSADAWSAAANTTWSNIGTMPVKNQTMVNSDGFVYYLDRKIQFFHNHQSATGTTNADSATQTIEVSPDGYNGFTMFPFNGGTMFQHLYSWRAVGMWVETTSSDWVVTGPGINRLPVTTGFVGWVFDVGEHNVQLIEIMNSSPTMTTDSLTVTRIDFEADFVPEPSGALLFCIGTTPLLFRRRRALCNIQVQKP